MTLVEPARLAVAAVALFAGACGSLPAPVTEAAAGEVRVGLLEWEITTDFRAVAGGDVTLNVTNAGSTAHDLAVVGRGGVSAKTRVLPPGDTTSLVIAAKDTDELQLWCTVTGHRSQGMELRLPVRR